MRACRRIQGLSHSTDAAGCPALLRAAENGQEEMVRLLLGHGADIEARGPFEQSALASCACNQIDRRKRSRTLRLLLASGADVNGRIDRGRTPLFSAATAGWAPEESVRILLEHGADPHIRNDDGRMFSKKSSCVPRRAPSALRNCSTTRPICSSPCRVSPQPARLCRRRTARTFSEAAVRETRPSRAPGPLSPPRVW